MHTQIPLISSPIFSVFISFCFLTACTTVQVIESGEVRVERHFGFPVVHIQSSHNALTAVRLHGTGIMVSDSTLILGYVDDFSVRQDLTNDNGNCSMVVLVEDDVDATALLQELRLNKNKYADICAVHIN